MVIYTEQWQIATCVWEQRAENNHYTTKISVLGEFPLRLCLRERASSPQMKFACTLDNTWTIYNCKIGIALNVSALTLQKLPWGLLVKDYRSNQRFSLHKTYFKPAAYAKNGCNSLSVISMVQTEGREGSPNLSWSQCLLVFIQTLRNQQADTSGTIFCGEKSVTRSICVVHMWNPGFWQGSWRFATALECHHAIMQHVSSTVFNCRDFVSREM